MSSGVPTRARRSRRGLVDEIDIQYGTGKHDPNTTGGDMNSCDRTSRGVTGVVVALVAALSLGVGAALQPVVAQGMSYLTQTFRIGAATPYNLTWPADDGASDGILQTDGAGVLTWATDLDVAGGIEAGSGDVALVGIDGKINGPLSSTILDDLNGANLTDLNGSQIATGTVAPERMSDLSASKITSGTLARARLGFGENSASGNTDTLIAMNAYSFYPNWRGCSGSFATMKGRNTTNTVETARIGYFYLDLAGSCSGSTSWIVKWAYLSASDRPSVWVVVDATGEIVALWEGEDPISADDTVSPLTTDDPTHRAVNMGVPSLAVITALDAALTTDQQADLLTRLDAYVAAERGWLGGVTTLVALATIEARYEPSGRQWAMRLLAEVRGISVIELYRTDLAVDTATDTWVVPSE